MNVFSGVNASEVWLSAVGALQGPDSVVHVGRGGTTRELLHVAFEVADPRQRWVFERKPAMNPAFALAEVVWIVVGRNDASFLNFWNPVLSRFAGSDATYHGAYGFRLRHHFGIDQLTRLADALRANPSSRQGVLQIWDPAVDLPDVDGGPIAADIPCNVTSLLKVRGERLEWLQVIRSNDIFLGTPHNFVQFMTLQEILAGWIGVDVGAYVQISDSLHVYERDLGHISGPGSGLDATNTDRFAEPRAKSLAHFTAVAALMDELRQPEVAPRRCAQLAVKLNAPESYKNLLLVVAADAARRHGGAEEALSIMSSCTNPAYQLAWASWYDRIQGHPGTNEPDADSQAVAGMVAGPAERSNS